MTAKSKRILLIVIAIVLAIIIAFYVCYIILTWPWQKLGSKPLGWLYPKFSEPIDSNDVEYIEYTEYEANGEVSRNAKTTRREAVEYQIERINTARIKHGALRGEADGSYINIDIVMKDGTVKNLQVELGEPKYVIVKDTDLYFKLMCIDYWAKD